MELRILGSRQAGSADGRASALLVDGTIALDAGALCEGLPVAAMRAVEHVLVTHHHWDHVRDLPFLGHIAYDGRWAPRQVYCSHEVHALLRRHVLNGVLWPDFFTRLAGPEREPGLAHRPVAGGDEFPIGAYGVTVLDNPVHSVPVLAYLLTAPGGRTLLVTGDAGPGVSGVWLRARPDVLVAEATCPDAAAALARRTGHLTPSLLEAELVAFRAAAGYLPRVLVGHVAQAHLPRVAAELAGVAQRLGAAVEVAHDGMHLRL